MTSHLRRRPADRCMDVKQTKLEVHLLARGRVQQGDVQQLPLCVARALPLLQHLPPHDAQRALAGRIHQAPCVPSSRSHVLRVAQSRALQQYWRCTDDSRPLDRLSARPSATGSEKRACFAHPGSGHPAARRCRRCPACMAPLRLRRWRSPLPTRSCSCQRRTPHQAASHRRRRRRALGCWGRGCVTLLLADAGLRSCVHAQAVPPLLLQCDRPRRWLHHSCCAGCQQRLASARYTGL